MSKFYAVRVGRIPGIYRTWDECKKQVNGFSGAIFKSFKVLNDAHVFAAVDDKDTKKLGRPKDELCSSLVTKLEPKLESKLEPKLESKLDVGIKKIAPKSTSNKSLISELNKLSTNVVILLDIYTDGSHSKHIEGGYIGYGAWCKYYGVEYSLSGHLDHNKLPEYGIDKKEPVSNPTAEFMAFAEVLKRFVFLKTKVKLTFWIDYIGVQKWMAGEWQAKKSYIQKIKRFCQERLLDIARGTESTVEIKYVPGHTGVLGNEKADKLAKNETTIDEF